MLIMICFQWRMSKGLAEISIVLPTALELGPGFAAPMLPQASPSDSRLLGATDRPEPRTHEQEPGLQPAPRRRERTGKSIESRIFPGGGDSFRRKQFRALRVAVIVGLICAAVLAVLFYVVTTQEMGFQLVAARAIAGSCPGRVLRFFRRKPLYPGHTTEDKSR